MTYTLEEIKRAWDAFDAAKAFCVLKDGKWTDTPMLNGFCPPAKIDGTAAKIKWLKDVMSFAKFLEEFWVSK